MLEIKKTSPIGDLKFGHTTVGPTPVPVSPNSIQLVRGILLRAPGPNDLTQNRDVIYIGLSSVTPGTNSATDGMPLLPGKTVKLRIDDPSLIFAVSQTPGQSLAWTGI